MKKFLLFLILIISLPSKSNSLPAQGPTHGSGAYVGEKPHIESWIVSNYASITPGEEFLIGIYSTLPNGWHIYWKNPGDAGLPTSVIWRSSFVEFGNLQWPTPEQITDKSGQIVNYGYHNEVLLWNTARLKSTYTETNLTIKTSMKALVCNEATCIPANYELQKVFPVASSSSLASDEELKLFETFSLTLPAGQHDSPLLIEPIWAQYPVRPGDTVSLFLGISHCPKDSDTCNEVTLHNENQGAYFIPYQYPDLSITAKKVHPHPTITKGKLIELQVLSKLKTKERSTKIEGILKYLESPNKSIQAVQLSIDIPHGEKGQAITINKGIPLAQPSQKTIAQDVNKGQSQHPLGSISLLSILLFAFLGGLILNIMPCVLPVLALKLFSLTAIHQQGLHHRLKHGIGFLFGIMSSFWLLAAIIIFLQQAGTKVGWGFQFQQPLYLIFVSFLLTIFALNLFGVFELTFIPGSKQLHQITTNTHGYGRSYFEGVLTVILATPCSAPFLATATGFALSSTWIHILLVFTFIALGLAAPFTLASIVPGMQKIIPKPGNWMEILKQFLGFALLGTVVWLVWIYGRTNGIDKTSILITLLLFGSLASWVIGITQRRTQKKFGYSLAALLLIGCLYAGSLLGQKNSETEELSWLPYNKTDVISYLQQGNLVFVDFTADWCLTCKVNETTILASQHIEELFKKQKVILFKADWTKKDETLRRELARFGKGGVPMYLVYSPNRPDNPEILPEVLTTSIVTKAIKRAMQ